MEKEKNIEYNLDICKIIGAFLIVAIHCRPLTSLSDLMDFYLVDIVARLAVPFFLQLQDIYFLENLLFQRMVGL